MSRTVQRSPGAGASRDGVGSVVVVRMAGISPKWRGVGRWTAVVHWREEVQPMGTNARIRAPSAPDRPPPRPAARDGMVMPSGVRPDAAARS
jgi:hypothetical protein